jgi:hypothetical protein
VLLQKDFSKAFERWLTGALEVERLALYGRSVTENLRERSLDWDPEE